MHKSFKNILIPADFTINTEVAIEKALEIADPNPTIHLLYIDQEYLPVLPATTESFIFPAASSIPYEAIEETMKRWKTLIINRSQPGNIITVKTSLVIGGPVQKIIEDKAKQLFVDIIIIGKNSHHSWFPLLNTVTPSFLSFCTKIPVLTVKPGSKENELKNIVVGITGQGTENKLAVITALCRKSRFTIHLVTFDNKQNKPDGFYAGVLAQYYQLAGALHCPVKYVVLSNNNTAKALLTYARKADADMILAHPETETKTGWGKHISDLLPVYSKIQVCAV